MKRFRSVAGKVAWVGRTASMVFGLALVMALVFGVATTALSATGGNFILGRVNVATTASKLTANVTAPALTLVNNSTDAAATALNITVPAGKAPLKVNTTAGKATNLDADKLDGLDASAIGEMGRERWAVINADGSIARSRGVDAAFTERWGPGHYQVAFSGVVSNCAWVATTTNGFAGQTGVFRTQSNFSTDVQVVITNSSGTPADLPFHVVVTG